MKKRNGSTYKWRKLREKVLKEYDYRCVYCGKRANHVDHVSPFSQVGHDEPDNLVAACATCNLRKGSKDPRKFLEQMSGEKILKPKGFFNTPSTSPTPSLSFSPENIGSPFEPPGNE